MSTTRLTPMEEAMTWERMSGETLPEADRQRILDGGEFVPPHMRKSKRQAKREAGERPAKCTGSSSFTPCFWETGKWTERAGHPRCRVCGIVAVPLLAPKVVRQPLAERRAMEQRRPTFKLASPPTSIPTDGLGFGAVGPSGRVDPNTVRIVADKVRIRAGWWGPVPVRVVYDASGVESAPLDEDLPRPAWARLAKLLGARLERTDSGQWRVADARFAALRWARFATEAMAGHAFCALSGLPEPLLQVGPTAKDDDDQA